MRAARSIGNLRDTLRIVRGRFARRPAVYPRLNWVLWISVVVVLAAACAFFLDEAAGRHVGKWPDVLRAYSRSFTVLGHGQWYLAPAVAWLLVANQIDWGSLSPPRLMAAYRRTCLAFLVLVAVGVPGLVVNIAKVFVGRARPFKYTELGAFSAHPFEVAYAYASFPSGHATTMGAVAAVLVLLFPRWKYFSLPVCFSIAATRVFVGVHYPSDVVVGFGLGFGLAMLTGLVFARLGFVFGATSDGIPVLRPIYRSIMEAPNQYPAEGTGSERQFST